MDEIVGDGKGRKRASTADRQPAAAKPLRQSADERWRSDNIGRLLTNALRHFESRVLEILIAAGHDKTTPSHVNATRHLDVEGTRLTEMARRAAMTKQSMSELIVQLEALDLVGRRPDPLDGRGRIVFFTPLGLEWLDAFRDAVKQAEREMRRHIGADALQATKEALQRYDMQQADAALPAIKRVRV